MRNIRVVTHEKYKDIGRSTVHLISKYRGFRCAVWSIKQFEENEFQNDAGEYVFFIGDMDIAKAYLKNAELKKTNSNAWYGWDGSKAIAFCDDELTPDNIKDIIIEEFKQKGSDKKAQIFKMMWKFTGIVYVPGINEYLLYRSIKKLNDTKMIRTALATQKFMEEEFERWVGL